ncbi:hypothetical protein CXG81DRAFT_30419 [Caulochytrium protostelioides]|uniref:homogentisate 1,2-dioxygenase n=1 Tax=Caulochytrium protostelioides TaxID=1555241 RepID=A0A4P9X0S5_9FUNG|nr:hypothetical protein CXG81DRAFT_30419 [Caulochytrium protostelioides]|eukprot:RKO98602.1 hypothetical protein CXG81DRAFT_30419 [Caulochytrium protostelioides]
MAGFDNEHQTEALPGALPQGQNNPQQCPYGLYAEQLSGTAFTAPRAANQRTWFYRIRPSVCHQPFVRLDTPRVLRNFDVMHANAACEATPNQLRWSPFEVPAADAAPVDFVQGLHTVAGTGDPALRQGLAIYVYALNAPMRDKAFYNADADFLIVLQQGRLRIQTEMGMIQAEPHEIVVIPKGIRYAVTPLDGPSRGYILETFSGHWELPELGPIGANGLAHPRDFLYPTAHYVDTEAPWNVVGKFQGQLFTTTQHCPFDVVAWHGNLAPFKYDLRRFQAINSVSYDHPDPSIFTVLTVRSNTPGTAVADFVYFPSRWTVADHTFRPPWFHRNCMTEFMGLIAGQYDAKAEGFLPGGASLHSCMTAHGPDRATFELASTAPLAPHYVASAAFMFETCYTLALSKWALDPALPGGRVLQRQYYQCWSGLERRFRPDQR